MLYVLSAIVIFFAGTILGAIGLAALLIRELVRRL